LLHGGKHGERNTQAFTDGTKKKEAGGGGTGKSRIKAVNYLSALKKI